MGQGQGSKHSLHDCMKIDCLFNMKGVIMVLLAHGLLAEDVVLD